MASQSTRETVLVTGATGRIGRFLVDELLRRGASVRALTRRPEAAVLPPGVEVVGGDFTLPASLDTALAGTSMVFLMWAAPPVTAPAVIKQLASRPRRVVYLSAPFRTPHPFFQQPNPMRDLHAEIEGILAAARLDATILRPGMFASNALHWWGSQISDRGVVRWPYAAVETAPIDERDIAATAVQVLLQDGHAGGDYVLTGPESLSHVAQVRAIGDAVGRSIRFEEVSPEEFRRETAATWPGGVAEMLLAAWRAALGQPAFVTSTVREIVGSPARTFHQWAVDHAPAFSGAPGVAE